MAIRALDVTMNKDGGKCAIKKLCRIVTANKLQFSFMLEKGTIDAVLILRRLQEENLAKVKMYVFCGPRESSCQSIRK